MGIVRSITGRKFGESRATVSFSGHALKNRLDLTVIKYNHLAPYFFQNDGEKRIITVNTSSLPMSMKALKTHFPMAGMWA